MKKKQLFLLHFAGGDCYSFQFMITYLNKFSIIPLELPGRGNRSSENLKKNFKEAAQDIYKQILDKLDGSEFIIYGHSMGAILALKVVWLLEQSNKFPSYLFVSGSQGPTDKNKKRYLLDDKALIEEIAKYGGISREIISNRDFLDYYLPILRADLEIVEKDSYHKHVINTPIFAMMGKYEEEVNNISNWKEFTKSAFNFQLFNGDHFFIHYHPNEIAKIISQKVFGLKDSNP